MTDSPPNEYKTDTMLARLKDSGREVVLHTLRGVSYRGAVKGFERYTVTIAGTAGEKTFFKHALEHIEIVP